jgi:hypothetical protein
MQVTDAGNRSENPGAVLRRLRHTGGRRISQRALATLLGTSRAHIARLELHGSPPLTDEQLGRLEKVGDAIQPPFSSAEIDELRSVMHTVGAAAIAQADRAVQDIADRAGQIFATTGRDEQRPEPPPQAVPDPFAAESRPRFLTAISQVAQAAQDDIDHLVRERRSRRPSRPGAEPDVIITNFGQRLLVEQAKEPEKFRDLIRDLLGTGGTVEVLIASSAEEASQDLVALVPPMIAYLGQGGPRYRAHVIDEARHPMAYDICVAGDRGLLIAGSDASRTVGVRTNHHHDVNALRNLVRPYWENKKPIIEEAGRRTRDTVTGRSPKPSVAMPFEQLLTSVEMEEGPRRLVKEGLSILNIPVAIHAWKWRAAELCTAGWIPEDLLAILHTQAWDLADHGARHLPPAVLNKYTSRHKVHTALRALEEYARSLRERHMAWAQQLSRHQFWDACPKSSLIRFISTGELPPDEIPPACKYKAEQDDVDTIITRLITRLRSTRNYHLALIDEPPIQQWFYFGVKAAHVLAQVFDNALDEEDAEKTTRPRDNMLNVHINYAPIAVAFAGWFDEHVLKAAVDPPWQDNHKVADWLEVELGKSRHTH